MNALPQEEWESIFQHAPSIVRKLLNSQKLTSFELLEETVARLSEDKQLESKNGVQGWFGVASVLAKVDHLDPSWNDQCRAVAASICETVRDTTKPNEMGVRDRTNFILLLERINSSHRAVDADQSAANTTSTTSTEPLEESDELGFYAAFSKDLEQRGGIIPPDGEDIELGTGSVVDPVTLSRIQRHIQIASRPGNFWHYKVAIKLISTELDLLRPDNVRALRASVELRILLIEANTGLGKIHRDLAYLRTAMELGQELLKHFSSNGEQDWNVYVDFLVQMANTHIAMANARQGPEHFSAAMGFLQQAEAWLTLRGSKQPKVLVAVYELWALAEIGLGSAGHGTEHFEKAIESIEKGIKLLKSEDNPKYTDFLRLSVRAHTRSGIGNAGLDHFWKGIDAIQELAKRLGPDRDLPAETRAWLRVQLASCYLGVGTGEHNLQHLDLAAALLSEASKIVETENKQHAELRKTIRTMLIRTYVAIGQERKALDPFQAAQSLLKADDGPNLKGKVYLGLADMAYAAQDLDSAQKYAQDVLGLVGVARTLRVRADGLEKGIADQKYRGPKI